MLDEYIHFPQGEDDGAETLPETAAENSGGHPLLDIIDITSQDSIVRQDDLHVEPLNNWLEASTIHPSQLSSMNPYSDQSNALSTSNGNNSQSPSTSEQPTISIQPSRRLRRIEPAPAQGSEGTSLEPSPSSTDTSRSASGSAAEDSSQPTPQDNPQTSTSLTCHCGAIAETESKLRYVGSTSLSL